MISVMNMEAMTWPDNAFDVVTMSQTLSYAKDTFAALSEVARVLRPGGRFAFSATVNPGAEVWVEDNVHGGQIAEMLHRLGFEITAHFPSEKINSSGKLQTLHAFAARKRPPGETRRDPFSL
jgi:ubiquinone/menaquinone biosynthesis C-methylase UbiE